MSSTILRDSSPSRLVEEKGPSYKSTWNTVESKEDCGPDMSVGECKEGIQDSTSPQEHFTYNDARPAFFDHKPKNVILFGETGAGKSSVINLMAGKEIALTSPNLTACTLQATQHWFSLPTEVPLCIFDTVGLEESDIGINTFLGAIEKAHKLVTSLHRAGGIDLLLFCIKGGRITATMQRSYRLFFEVLCESRVPLAIVVTNLETEDVMEDWWVRNETTFLQHGIHSVAHACITAIPARVTMYAEKSAESQIALQKMLLDTLSNPKPSYVQEIRSWFTAIVYLLRSFLTTNRKRPLRKRDLVRRLETRCKLPRSDAERLAQILTSERDM